MKAKQMLRAELFHLLSCVSKYPLTLVTGATGFGKTTTIRAYLEQSATEYLWLSLCDVEINAQCIWHSLTTQISRVDAEFSKQLNNMGFPEDENSRNRLLRYMDEYSLGQPYTLVIDDYHYVQCGEFDAFIRWMINYRLNHFHLIIISRTVPNLHVDEMVLKGFCSRIEEASFLLDAAEIKQFFTMHDIKLNKEMINKVLSLTGGWMTGVYMLMLHYRIYGDISFDDNMGDVVRSMVVDTFTSEEQRQLNILSLFECFTTEYAKYVLNDCTSIRQLRKSLNHTGFVLREPSTSDFRIQSFLVDYYKRNNTLDKQSLHEIYLRSGQWLNRHGSYRKGIDHYLKGGCYEEILKVFDTKDSVYLYDLHSKFIIHVFSMIPLEIKHSFPIAYLSFIGFYMTNVNLIEGKVMLDELLNFANNQSSWTDELYYKVIGEAAVAKSYLAYNDVVKMHEMFEEAYQLLGGTSMIATRDKLASCGSVHLSYMYHKEVGTYYKTADYVRSKCSTYEQLTGGCGAGFSNVFMAEYLCETSDYNGALLEAKKGLYKSLAKNQEDIALCSRVLQVRACFAIGEVAQGISVLQEIIELGQSCTNPIVSRAYDVAVAYLSYLLNDQDKIAPWLQEVDFDTSQLLFEALGYSYIAAGMTLLMKRDYIRLEVLIEKMMPEYDKFNHVIGYIHGYILSAIAKYQCYGFVVAEESLKKAIAYAIEDDIIQPFIEYTRDLMIVMEIYKTQHEGEPFVVKLWQHMKLYEQRMRGVYNNGSGLSQFTPRELDVLRLLVDGKSNREIAKELYVAEITVKKHVSAIYVKLDVHGRSLAVKKYLESKIV